MITPMRKTIAIATAIAAVAVLSACGEREERITSGGTAPFDLALDWYPNADHAGIYTALKEGYFADAGLELAPQVPSDPAAPIKQVAAGRADLAISYEPEVALAREQGLDVVAVAALANQPLTSLTSVGKDAIRDGRQLDGKRVATSSGEGAVHAWDAATGKLLSDLKGSFFHSAQFSPDNKKILIRQKNIGENIFR
jgi:putative hydroxymethylpyrimidine transport system substrate-binding protein